MHRPRVLVGRRIAGGSERRQRCTSSSLARRRREVRRLGAGRRQRWMRQRERRGGELRADFELVRLRHALARDRQWPVVLDLRGYGGGAAAQCSAPVLTTESPSGTTIPAATQIVDNKGNVWTLVNEQIARNGAIDPVTANVGPTETILDGTGTIGGPDATARAPTLPRAKVRTFECSRTRSLSRTRLLGESRGAGARVCGRHFGDEHLLWHGRMRRRQHLRYRAQSRSVHVAEPGTPTYTFGAYQAASGRDSSSVVTRRQRHGLRLHARSWVHRLRLVEATLGDCWRPGCQFTGLRLQPDPFTRRAGRRRCRRGSRYGGEGADWQ